MWAFLKRSDSTDTREMLMLREDNRKLQQLLADALQASQDLSARQQESLDRIIVSKFDVPVTRTNIPDHPVVNYRMPVEHLSDAIGLEDDREFLEAVHGSNEDGSSSR